MDANVQNTQFTNFGINQTLPPASWYRGMILSCQSDDQGLIPHTQKNGNNCDFLFILADCCALFGTFLPVSRMGKVPVKLHLACSSIKPFFVNRTIAFSNMLLVHWQSSYIQHSMSTVQILYGEWYLFAIGYYCSKTRSQMK